MSINRLFYKLKQMSVICAKDVLLKIIRCVYDSKYDVECKSGVGDKERYI